MKRRDVLACCVLGLFPPTVCAAPSLGNPEWMRRFGDFVRAFNTFVEALDENKLDHAAWERVRVLWKSIDAP
jgi:hypothetical protein